jgi:hypothetical protein
LRDVQGVANLNSRELKFVQLKDTFVKRFLRGREGYDNLMRKISQLSPKPG